MKKRVLVVLALWLGVIVSGHQTAAYAAHRDRSAPPEDAVITWNVNTADAEIAAGITPIFDPLHETRLNDMVHLAVHDALNAIDRRFAPYALAIRVRPQASPEAAVATAARDVLVPVLGELPPLFPPATAIQLVEDRYTAALDAIPEGKSKRDGIAVGHAAAAAILDRRAGDGADVEFLDFDYPQGTTPGQFRFVEGAPFAVAPLWGEVTPFALRDGSQFRPRPPYAVTGKQYAADYNELKQLGSLTGSTRTAEQTEIGLFWFEASPLRWNRIARTVSLSAGLDMWENARLFGLLNIALADGYIGNWDAKHYYNQWRPETAVRLGDSDGNPDTVGDPNWTPLWGSTGATPEYDSGHSIEGAAASVVLKRVLGTDHMTFAVCSYTLPSETCTDASPKLRTYHSFSQASEENGFSRILVGWHFRNAVEQGAKHGRKIGQLAVDRYLRPVHWSTRDLSD
jgi:hypothetical protein